eukprot:GFUD01015915.1.p1 GENE.GFUD01015915.1~~GFUD01015915.1.p1  ORF type:complete len:521 (-),score=128.06 GFUD01015915.1:235-1797(-)
MAGGDIQDLTGAQYSPLTGLIYIFNLIVGTGALTLPAAFHDAGWLLSSVIIILLAFMSYLTATFVIESMAAANAMIHWKRLQRLKRSGGPVSEQLVARTLQVQAIGGARETPSSPLLRAASSARRQEDDENQPLIDQDAIERIPSTVSNYYEITEITEMGRMASLFFSRGGRNMFYLCLVIYLYGDLAIYGAAVAKSVRDVACNYKPPNMTSPLNISDSELCWADSTKTRLDAYRIFLAVFVCTIGQFVFCNVTKTKYLQIATTLMRWQAFIVMVVLATLTLVNESPASPPASRISGLPNLFGVCVYSFMCHHSLPGLVTPISDKKKLYSLMLGDYAIILSFYFLLAFTGIFAFRDINDLYTLNFQPSPSDSWFLWSLHFFLSLFPVFTLSTNFPIIAITLSNNLKSLFLTEGRMYSYWTRTVVFPLLALVPPTCVAMATHSLEFLVGITGSYAGAGIQYIVPAALVYYARQEAGSALGVGVRNQHKSPFKHWMWVVFVQLWAITCIVFVTWNHISSAVS